MHLLARGALLAVLLGPPLVLLCDALHAQRVLILLRLDVDLPALHVRQDTLHAHHLLNHRTQDRALVAQYAHQLVVLLALAHVSVGRIGERGAAVEAPRGAARARGWVARRQWEGEGRGGTARRSWRR